MQEETIASKGRGAVQTIAGSIKRAFDRLMGHPVEEAQGSAEQLQGRGNIDRGNAGESLGKAGERFEGATQQIAGDAKQAAGNALGQERVAGEGRAKELEERARQSDNR